MPIKITNYVTGDAIACLCDDDWDLPTQLYALQLWMEDYQGSGPTAKTIADIGFSIRPDASGGGAILSAECMRRFADASVEIHFSEYP